ncbi:MAG TPA: hypothetical protein VH640_13870 [Bryobacteraceae bacterium]
MLHKDYTWTQDPAGNVYLGTAATTLNPGTSYAVQTKSVQTLDTYGNLVQSQVYDYANAATPARTYTYSYLTSSVYTSRYMRNLLTSASVTDSKGQMTVLGGNTFDYGYNSTCASPAAPPLDRPGLPMHDLNYSTSVSCRGDATTVVNLNTSTSYNYDIGGVPYEMQNAYGTPTSLSVTSNTNYSLPEVLTPNSVAGLATTVSYPPFVHHLH